jgi:hypothetical protein
VIYNLIGRLYVVDDELDSLAFSHHTGLSHVPVQVSQSKKAMIKHAAARPEFSCVGGEENTSALIYVLVADDDDDVWSGSSSSVEF